MRNFSLKFSEDEINYLEEIAHKNNIKANSVVREDLATGKYIRSKLESGAFFYVIEPNGDMKNVNFRF